MQKFRSKEFAMKVGKFTRAEWKDAMISLTIAARGVKNSCHGMREYDSFHSALRAVKSSNAPNRNIVYKCNYCGKFHIGARPTLQEIEAYESGADQACYRYAIDTGYQNAHEGKIRYQSRVHAKAANRLMMHDPDLNAYPCPYCHGWHLGHVRGTLE